MRRKVRLFVRGAVSALVLLVAFVFGVIGIAMVGSLVGDALGVDRKDATTVAAIIAVVAGVGGLWAAWEPDRDV